MPEGATFDEDEATKAIKFFDDHLHHTQGPKAGEAFTLAPEQAWLVREAFGWKRANGRRLYRTIYVEMGRANGKTQLGAGIAGKLLFADGELDPEVVSAASDRQQARICLDRLKSMIRSDPQGLDKLSAPLRSEIRRTRNARGEKAGGVYKATSSDVSSNWGGSPHGIIFDEVHAQPNRELWDALETAMGKRAQPMLWAFTTAGWDKESLCWELHEHTRELANDTITNHTFLGVVWAAHEDADWTDPQVWRDANPMMGVAFEEEFLAEQCQKALSTPAFQNTFRTMYLSQWVGQQVRFLDMTVWDANDKAPRKPDKVEAFGGLDLSSTTDLSSFVVVSRNGDNVDVHCKLYAPADGLVERERRDRLPYSVWAREGLLTLTPGPTIDQDYIKRDILAAKEQFKLKDVSYDRWNAAKLVKELENEGVVMVQMGQGFASMSAPCKELMRLATEVKLNHGGNKALRSQVSNAAGVIDAQDNIKPDKKNSGSRIDGLVALIMALDGLTRRGRLRHRSVWEDRV